MAEAKKRVAHAVAEIAARRIARGIIPLSVLVAPALLVGWQTASWAKPNEPTAISGLTNRDGGDGCIPCHGSNGGNITVTLTGPGTLTRGQSASYTVKGSLGSNTANKKMGVAIAAQDAGNTITGSAPLQYLSGSRELIHNSDLDALHDTNSSGEATYTFNYTMPSNAAFGSTHKLYAVARIHNGASNANEWAHAPDKTVTTVTPAPNITSSGSKSGQVGVPLSYQITVSSGNSIQPPTSYGASPRPAGIAINTSTGLLSGTPTAATNGTPVVTIISATNSADTDTKNLSFTIDKGDQTISFGSQTNPTYSPGGTFTLNPADTDPTSAPSPRYTSLDTNKCTMVSATGTTVNIVEAGTCRIKASQPGDSNWNAADPVAGITKTITIGKASQSISFPLQASRGFVANGTFTITDEASASSGLAITYTSLDPSVCTMPGTTSKTVTMIDIGTCPIRASQDGSVNYFGATPKDRDIQITETPGAPTLTAAHKGNGRATLEFTGPNNASSVQYYTGTCSATGQTTRTATSITPSTPIVVTGLTNGSTYVCRITATNSTGTGLESNFLFVAPDAPPPNVVPELRAAFSTGFVIGKNSSYTIVSTGTPTPTVTRSGAALPTGITFANTGGGIVTGTATLSGIAAPGTVGIYVVSLTATNSAGSDSENILVAVDKGKPVITFNTLADRTYSPTPFSISATIATPDSTLSASNIVFTSGSPSICSVSGTAVTMLAVGVCTIHANSTTNASYTASYNAAPQVTRSFDIDLAPQTITFNAQPTPRTFAPGATFPISPLATVNSPLTIAYASLSRRVCTVSGTTVTMVGGGTCKIEASQDGNALYAPAADVVQSVTISPAAQSISFGAQAAKPFVEGGSFAVNPVAMATSGLAVSYASLTPAVCALQSSIGPDVQILATGTCTLQATQAGNANYGAATPVSQNIAINAVPPGAPTLDVAIASDGRVMLSVIPPGTTGGAPVTGYAATCTPGPVQGNSGNTTFTVSGLTNGQAYSCSVTAQNAAGSSAPSNAIAGIVPFLDTGANLWTAKCSGCHDTTPAAARFNAAGETGTVLNYVRANQATMLADSGVQGLTANELSEIAKYIKSFVPAINVTADYVTPKMIDVGLPNHLYLGGVAFTDAVVVTPPVNGTLSIFNGTVITYTPNPGFSGTDSFTYRGRRTSPQLLEGEARTVTIMVNTPAAPVVTSGNAANGVFNQAFSYQITASNSPASYGASGLPPGVTVNTGNGLVSGTPTAAGVYNATLSATNPGGTGQLAVTITISATNQTITFGAQGAQSFAPNGMFAINPLATATSGLAVTYSSLTPGVCSVSGSTVTLLTAGTCTIAANQGGNGNFNAALQVTQNVAINPTAPGAPAIGSATPGNGTATIAFSAPASNGGSPITQYNATCTPSGAGSNTVSPITITTLANNTQYTCSVTATNAAGTSGPSGTVMVTPVNANVPPQFTSASGTTFTVLNGNTFNVTASGTPAPVLTLQSGTLPTGVSFVNGLLSGTPASGTAAGSPYNLVFLADGFNPDATQNFALTVAKQNQTITFNNPGVQHFSPGTVPITVSASSGLGVTLASNTTSVCTVSANNLTTVTTGVCSITASQAGNADVNAANNVTNAFSINPASQAITFGAQTSPRSFSTTPFALSPVAFASSALPIAYSTTTPSVCTANGTSITTLSAGTCTIAANQAGNANYAAAPQVTQNVTVNAIAPGAPTIGAASGSDQQASISFTAPASNGGSPISQYTATCAPSGSASGSASPIVVSGLTNGQSYTCSVTATNMAGQTSAASGSVNVTPTSANGAALWSSVCTACHSQTPSGNQLNSAGSTATVLQHVRATQPLMANFAPVQNLTQADLAALAVYVRDQLPANNPSTAQNTALPINVAGHVTFTNQAWSAFSSVEVVTPPASGNLSAFTGTTATYTPNNGFTGTDSFTYRGKRTAPDVLGDPIQVTITVLPGAPVITSATTANGTFNAPFSYQITASGSPTAFGATNLPNGLGVDAAGLITGTPDATGVFGVTISATNAGGTTNANLTITVGQAAQTINFPAQTIPARSFVQGGSFAIDPVATGGASGQPVSYGSSTPGICTVSGTTVSIVAAGTCTIAANQAGNANYNAASPVTRPVAINAVVPGAPTIGNATPGNMSALIAFSAPANTGGANITGYNVACTPNGAGSGTASPVAVGGLTNGVTYTCTVSATNSAGAGAASQPVNVMPQQITVPDAPVIGVPTPLNGAARIAFTPPVNNGGSAILFYTATCNPGMFSNNGAASPITVSGLANGNTVSCSVIATNAVGASVPSASLDVTPVSSIALTGVVSRKTHGAAGPFPIDIDLAQTINGAVTVEPRAIGAGHQIVFQFDQPVTAAGTVSAVDTGNMPVGSASAMMSGNDVIVTLTGIANASRVTVSLTGVNGTASASASLGFLVGDVNNNRAVSAADGSSVKARSGQTADAGNFRHDLNASGVITAADIAAAKAKVGTALP